MSLFGVDGRLRFINKGDRMILQQAWMDLKTGYREWINVPVAEKCEDCDGGMVTSKGTMGEYITRCGMCDGSGYR